MQKLVHIVPASQTTMEIFMETGYYFFPPERIVSKNWQYVALGAIDENTKDKLYVRVFGEIDERDSGQKVVLADAEKNGGGVIYDALRRHYENPDIWGKYTEEGKAQRIARGDSYFHVKDKIVLDIPYEIERMTSGHYGHAFPLSDLATYCDLSGIVDGNGGMNYRSFAGITAWENGTVRCGDVEHPYDAKDMIFAFIQKLVTHGQHKIEKSLAMEWYVPSQKGDRKTFNTMLDDFKSRFGIGNEPNNRVPIGIQNGRNHLLIVEA